MEFDLAALLAAALILSGTLLCLIGAIGLLRLPDCYTRMHAASKAGALGAVLMLASVVAATSGEVAVEAAFALAMLLASAPLAAHAVARAAQRAGHRPLTGALGNARERDRTEGTRD